MKKIKLNWKKRTASDLMAPQRFLTASRRLWRISAPPRLGLRLTQPNHNPGAQRRWSEIDRLEEQRRIRHCSSELHMKLPWFTYASGWYICDESKTKAELAIEENLRQPQNLNLNLAFLHELQNRNKTMHVVSTEIGR